eukprot:11189870-Lingulodinium_polyedra.AAC.1
MKRALLSGEDQWPALRKWAASLNFLKETIDESGWDGSSPTFSGCCPASQVEFEKSGFSQTWQKTCLCSVFMGAWKDSLKGGPGPKLLVDLCRAILEELLETFATAEDWQQATMSPIIQTARAIVAMAWPMPQAYGSGLADV